MKVRRFLTITTILLFCVSIVHINWELISNRWLRVLTSLVFLLFAYKITGFQKIFKTPIFIAFICCDLLLLKWEFTTSKYLYYSLHSLICIALIYLTLRELRIKDLPKISILENITLLLFFAINSWILITLGSFFSEVIENPQLEALFYINGFLIISLVLAAFFYSTNFSSKFSSLFFLSVLGLTISELMIFSIYFLGIQEFRYIDNLFYIFGLFCFLRAFQEHKIWKEEEAISDLRSKEEEKVLEAPREAGVYR